MTGHGGWPMTSFLTAKGEPFFCGTYWPSEPRHGMPSFPQVLPSVAETWRDSARGRRGGRPRRRRAAVAAPRSAGSLEVTAELLDKAAASLNPSYDGVHGGLGVGSEVPAVDGAGVPAAPVGADRRGPGEGRPHLRGDGPRRDVRPARRRLRALLRRRASGWCRTSRRCSTTTPCCCGSTCTGGARQGRRSPSGSPSRPPTSCSATCAPRRAASPRRSTPTPNGVEGLTYAWTPAQLREVLGDDAEWAAEQLEVTAAGTFEHGSSTLQRLLEPDDAERYERVSSALLAARNERPQPGRDDKVVAAWNGLAVAALAEAGVLLDRPGLPRRRQSAAPPWCRTCTGSTAGCVGSPATASSAGTSGCSRTTPTSPRGCWPSTPRPATSTSCAAPTRCSRWCSPSSRTATAASGTPPGRPRPEPLVRRPQDPTDNATPSGAAAAAGALLSYAALTGSAPAPGRRRGGRRHAGAAVRPARPLRRLGAARSGRRWSPGPPRSSCWTGPTCSRWPGSATSPGAVIAVNGPLAEGREPGAAYVCRQMVCELPTTDAGAPAGAARRPVRRVGLTAARRPAPGSPRARCRSRH